MFDKEEYFLTEIKPKLDEIVKLCNREQIAFFSAALVSDKKDNSAIKYEYISPTVTGLDLPNNKKMNDFFCVVCDFKVVPPVANAVDLAEEIPDFDDFDEAPGSRRIIVDTDARIPGVKIEHDEEEAPRKKRKKKGEVIETEDGQPPVKKKRGRPPKNAVE